MATLDSSSTRDEIEAEYHDTASWLEDADIDKAKRFHTAVVLLEHLTAQSVRDGGQDYEIREDLEKYRQQRKDVRSFLNEFAPPKPAGAEPGVTHFGFDCFR